MFRHGALVGVESGALATIVSQDPIYALFPVSQRQILAVRRRLEERGRRRQAVVRLQLSDNSAYAVPARSISPTSPSIARPIP